MDESALGLCPEGPIWTAGFRVLLTLEEGDGPRTILLGEDDVALGLCCFFFLKRGLY